MKNEKPPWERTPNYSPKSGTKNLKRSVGTRNYKQRILIVCEGTKTEPNYFSSFPINKKVYFVDVKGGGRNTLSLVKAAIDLKNSDSFTQTWCVFDRDSFSARQFNAAFQVAQSNDISVAYSNEAFEIWYLLHFNYYDAAINRKEYGKMLSKLLGHKYEKNSKTIYNDLLNLQPKALQNARRLYNSYNPCKPERDNPSTTVHLLVATLNALIDE